MKKRIMLGLALLVSATIQSWACTNFIVGKAASKDGYCVLFGRLVWYVRRIVSLSGGCPCKRGYA